MKPNDLPYRDGDCVAAFLADVRRRPRRLCVHLRSQPEQLGFRFMVFRASDAAVGACCPLPGTS
jgi:hypothetical protein